MKPVSYIFGLICCYLQSGSFFWPDIMVLLSFLFGIIAVCSALPANPSDPVISTLGGDQRFQYMRSADGTPHLVDTWLKISDLEDSARFAPDTENVYHLFTRANPSVSQPLLLGATNLLQASNYDPSRRTVVFVHGWTDSASGNANRVLVPAFLEAEDVNVISVDWSSGSGTINYLAAVVNTVTSGESVARFINWLNAATGSTPAQYFILGHSLGGHQSGIIARNVDGNVAYVTALDPALPAWVSNIHKFREDDADYTEVIHTNAGLAGYITPLGHADFYPNGGITMPGCDSQACDHDRCFYYMAESLTTGGFTGTQCATYLGALFGNCILSGRLEMGGLMPKTGSSGIYHLETNAGPPFARG